MLYHPQSLVVVVVVAVRRAVANRDELVLRFLADVVFLEKQKKTNMAYCQTDQQNTLCSQNYKEKQSQNSWQINRSCYDSLTVFLSPNWYTMKDKLLVTIKMSAVFLCQCLGVGHQPP
jgi:hypothetical protein